MRFKRKSIVVILSFLIATPKFPLISSPLQAGPTPTPKVFVGSAPFPGNLGLSYCPGPAGVGCIEQIIIDGQILTPTSDSAEADYRVGGGVYARQCRFSDGTKSTCQYPYLEFRKITGVTSMDTVELRFQRPDSPTQELRLGSTVVGGEVISFTPSIPGESRTAEVKLTTVLFQDGAEPWPRCVGLQFLIEDCTPANIAYAETRNRASILLIPGLVSPILPPEIEQLDPICAGPQDPRNCFTAVLEETSLGTWVDSNASFTGPSGSALQNGSLEFMLGGPHLKFGSDPINFTNADLNLGRFRYFLPSAYLQTAFGLSPEQVNATTLPVRRVSGSTASTPITTYASSQSGVIVDTTNISFSIPKFSIERLINVERGRTLDKNLFFAEAGMSRVLPNGTPQLDPLPEFVQMSGDNITFTDSGEFILEVTYFDSSGNPLLRYIKVNVVGKKSSLTPPTSMPSLPATH